MILESEIGVQRLLNKLDRRFPRVGAQMLAAGFRMTSWKQDLHEKMHELLQK